MTPRSELWTPRGATGETDVGASMPLDSCLHFVGLEKYLQRKEFKFYLTLGQGVTKLFPEQMERTYKQRTVCSNNSETAYNFTKQENSRDFGLAKRHRKCTVESEHRISFLEEQKDPPAVS